MRCARDTEENLWYEVEKKVRDKELWYVFYNLKYKHEKGVAVGSGLSMIEDQVVDNIIRTKYKIDFV